MLYDYIVNDATCICGMEFLLIAFFSELDVPDVAERIADRARPGSTTTAMWQAFAKLLEALKNDAYPTLFHANYCSRASEYEKNVTQGLLDACLTWKKGWIWLEAHMYRDIYADADMLRDSLVQDALKTMASLRGADGANA